MNESGLISISEILDNIYQYFKLKKITEKEFLKFPKLPTKLSEIQRYESSAILEEDLTELKRVIAKRRRKDGDEAIEYQLNFFNELIENYKKAKLLSVYYSDNLKISDEIIEQSNVKNQNLFIIFSDIRDFTTISEALDADEVAFFLSEYFKKVFELTKSLGIEIDKIIGDAYLALTDSERSIAYFVVQINNVIKMFNEHFQSNPTPKHEEINTKLQNKTGFRKGLQIRSGIGIHYGKLIKGDIGTTDRADHTVIGDTVNVAARIEGLTKIYMNEDDLSLKLYSFEVIEKLSPWIINKVKQLDKVEQRWREQLTTINDLTNPIEDENLNELRLTMLNEQNMKMFREIIGFSIKGKKHSIRIFTDYPYDKKFAPHYKLYTDAIKRYHMGGNSMFTAYQSLISISEKVLNDKVVNNALNSVAQHLSEHFFDLCKQKIKREQKTTSQSYSKAVVHLKFGNFHKAMANFIDFLDYKYQDNLVELKDVTGQYMTLLNELADKLDYKNALMLLTKFSEIYAMLENLVSSYFHLLNEVEGYDEFINKVEDKIDSWKKLILKVKHRYKDRLKIIPIILLYSRMFNKHCNDQELYHPIISDWEDEVLQKNEENKDLTSLNIEEVINAIKLSRYKVNKKTRELLKYQLFVVV